MTQNRHRPIRLQVEGLDSPIGVAVANPRFSWRIEARGPDIRQVAYELEVRTERGEPVARSGRVTSDETTAVRIPDLRLESRSAYEWSVRTWVAEGDPPSEWTTAAFETALLDASEWVAPWVTPVQPDVVVERYSLADALNGVEVAKPVGERLHPPLHVRQDFELDGSIARARLRMTARGIYTAELNGSRVGTEVLAPGYDSYGSRVSAQTYDVTALLRPGANTLGATVADGWFAGRIGFTGSSAQYGDRLSVSWQLEIRYTDGRTSTVGAGPEARSARGPRDWADLFIGERYDARRELVGWSDPGFDDTGWLLVSVSSEGTDVVVPFLGEPVRRTREFPPTSITRTPGGDLIIDAGQVVAGRVRIMITAPAGHEIRLEHSEVLDAAGEFFDNVLGPNKDQTDVYVAAGRDREVFEPEFTFHGFRYVRVTGLDSLTVDDVAVVVIGSDLRETSRFEASDARLSRLHENVLWSQRANFLSIPTDCPQRERAGWTGDLQVFIPAASTNMAVQPFVERWLANVRADQRPNGEVPMIVPVMPHLDDSETGITAGTSAGWGDAIVIVPWVLYERYGDPTVLRENYAAMVAWVEYQRRIAERELPDRLHDTALDEARRARQSLLWNTGFHFGDWLAPSTLTGPLEEAAMVAPALTGEITAAMFHAYSLSLLSKVARVLGETADAERFADRHLAVAEAFAHEYVAADGRLPVELQGPYVNALAFGLIPPERVSGAVGHLVELIHSSDDHLDTGFVSVPYLLDVLWEHDQRDLARTLLLQNTSPSWLYEVELGATTIWESWVAIAPDGTPQPMSMNHYAFGCVDDWMFRRLAGVAPTAPGYREFVVEPDLEGPLDRVAAAIETPSGEIVVEWARQGGTVEIEVTVPANTVARLELGATSEAVGSGRHTRTVELHR